MLPENLGFQEYGFILAAGAIFGAVFSRIKSIYSYFNNSFTGKVTILGEYYLPIATEISKNPKIRSIMYGKLNTEATLSYESSPKIIKGLGSTYLFTKIAGVRCLMYSSERVLEFGTRDLRITLWCAPKKVKKIEAWAEEIINKYCAATESYLKIYTYKSEDWELANIRNKRPLKTIYSTQDIPNKIIREIEKWKKTEQNCITKGLNYHLGILLSGPSGTGKTSLAMALASELNMDLYIFSGYDIDALSLIPNNSLILFDECDSMLSEDKDSKKKDSSLAKFLTILDGPLSKHGQIRVFTTNNKESLSSSLMRPGRIDFIFECEEPAPTTFLEE